MGGKCKLMRPMGDTWETSANSCGPRHPERRQVWETSVGDKWETSVKSCALFCNMQLNVLDDPAEAKKALDGKKPSVIRPETPRVKDKCGRQVEDKSKLMLPKEPYGNIHSRAYGLRVLRF